PPGELGRGFVNLPAQGEASALLPLARLPEAGGVVRIPDDELPLDNRRVFAAGRAGTLHVLLREDGPPSALQLALAAGSPASGLAVEAVDGAALPQRLHEADVLVLNDLERRAGAARVRPRPSGADRGAARAGVRRRARSAELGLPGERRVPAARSPGGEDPGPRHRRGVAAPRRALQRAGRDRHLAHRGRA